MLCSIKCWSKVQDPRRKPHGSVSSQASDQQRSQKAPCRSRHRPAPKGRVRGLPPQRKAEGPRATVRKAMRRHGEANHGRSECERKGGQSEIGVILQPPRRVCERSWQIKSYLPCQDRSPSYHETKDFEGVQSSLEVRCKPMKLCTSMVSWHTCCKRTSACAVDLKFLSTVSRNSSCHGTKALSYVVTSDISKAKLPVYRGPIVLIQTCFGLQVLPASILPDILSLVAK